MSAEWIRLLRWVSSVTSSARALACGAELVFDIARSRLLSATVSCQSFSAVCLMRYSIRTVDDLPAPITTIFFIKRYGIEVQYIIKNKPVVNDRLMDFSEPSYNAFNSF